MVYLDPHIADYHLNDADQYRVELTLPYSALLDHLATIYPNSEALLTERINKLIDFLSFKIDIEFKRII